MTSRITQAMRDKSKAHKMASALAKPFRDAAASVQAEIDTYKTPAEIMAETSANFESARAANLASATNTSQAYANIGQMFSGLMGNFEGADTTSFIERMGGGAASTVQNANDRNLAIDFAQSDSYNRDVGTSRAERRDLTSKRRDYLLQADVAASDWQSELDKILGRRGARMDLASKALSLKQQREALANAGSGRGSGGGSGSGSSGGSGSIYGGDPFAGMTQAAIDEAKRQGNSMGMGMYSSTSTNSSNTSTGGTNTGGASTSSVNTSSSIGSHDSSRVFPGSQSTGPDYSAPTSGSAFDAGTVGPTKPSRQKVWVPTVPAVNNRGYTKPAVPGHWEYR